MRSVLLTVTVLASSWATGIGVQVALQTTAAAAAVGMGPMDPDTNFPAWYGDSNGKRLELCLDGAPNCLAAAADLVAPDGEAFYFNANTTLTTSGGKSLLVLGTESAFAAAGAGQESVFNRTRIRIQTSNGGDFTVTWPYGQKTYHVDGADPARFEINETVDLGCIAAAPDNTCNDALAPNFSDVTASLQPFLYWDPAVAPAPPAGFIGDAATPHKVLGSPTGSNVWRVQGPNINPTPAVDGCPTLGVAHNLADCLETTDFVVQGKLAGPLTSDPKQLVFGSQGVGKASQLTATIKNVGPAPMTISGDNKLTVVDPASPNAADFRVASNGCANKLLTTDATCTVTVEFKPVAPGQREATLLVATTTPQINTPLHVALTGFGVGAGTAAQMSVSPTGMDFATVHVGAESAAQTVTVRNTSSPTDGTGAPLNISKIALGGANPTEFHFAGVGCQPKGGILPGDSCQISVAFAPVHGGSRAASLDISSDAVTNPQQSVALTGIGDPGVVAVGPVDTTNPLAQFPSWYQDKTGMKLMPCLDAVPPCFTAAADLTPPDGEGFYMGADALMDTAGGGKARLVISTELAYAGDGPGQEITFNRIRFFDTGGLKVGGAYKVTHPYGTDTYIADSNGEVLRRNATQDIGCVAPPCNPDGWATLEQSRVGPFLRWDPAQAPVPPLGYVGDGASLHRLTGSPYNTNIFRIEGPDINPNPTVDACPTLAKAADYPLANCVETDQFTLQGKILGPGAVTFSPPGGAYSTPQQVTLTTTPTPLTDDTGVKLYYTTDGTEPSLASTAYTGPFTVPANTIVKAIALNANGGASRATATYTLGAAQVSVTANPPGGTYAAAQQVTLTPSDPTASVYYTEDGSVPTSSSTLFVPGSTINVASSKTLKFIGVVGSGQPQVFSETYTIANDKSDVGPVDPPGAAIVDGFPEWYQDTTGLRLEPCFDPTNCFAVLPNPTQPLAFPSNYPSEAFYFGSKAIMLSVGNGGRGDLILGTESAFLPGPDAAAGQQVTFNRIRIKASGLVPGELYTVRHPYGVEQLRADTLGSIAFTEDVGCGAAPCDFRAALAGRGTPWLRWTSGAPAGYIGGGATATNTVTGSPLNPPFNKFRIEGLNAGGTGVNFVETDQFTVQGKIAGPSIVANPKGGSFPTAQSVTLSSDDPNAKIFYTVDGSTPNTGSALYTGPISIIATTTLKALAVNVAGTQSAVLSEVYTIDATAPTVSANPTSTTVLPVTVTLTSNELGTIYYTTDGTTTPSPKDTSGVTKVFNSANPIQISTPTVLKFVAVDTAGNSSSVGTETYGVIPPATIPAAPTGLTATAGSNQVGLTWTASSGATSYNIKRSNVAGGPYTALGSVTGTSGIDTSAVNGTTYFYVVTAANSAGESGNSNEASATPAAAAAVPAAPTNLVATAGNGQVSLTWTTSTGAASYTVKRSLSAGGPYGAVTGGTGLTSPSFTDTTVANGTRYFYVVTAVNTVGESGNSNEASATPVAPPTVPGAPTGLTATAGDARANLAWNASLGAVSYTVKRATVAGGPYTALTAGTGLTTTAFTDATALNGTTYFYVVTAVNSAGSSPNSNEASATPQAAPLAPAVRLSPTGLAFGTTKGGVKIGTTSPPQTVTLTNTGTATLTFSQPVGLGGASPNRFAISANTCGTSVAPGASCSVSVTFTPLVKGTVNATLVFTDNAGVQTVDLLGKGN